MQRLSPNQPLFHWSPVSVRDSIRFYGLRTHQKNVIREHLSDQDDGWRAPWICAGISPREAWRFIGLCQGQYDLWQIIRDPTDKIRCRKDGGVEIIEVRIHNDIPKVRLFYVGTREAHTGREGHK